jgi:hypothetical protein
MTESSTPSTAVVALDATAVSLSALCLLHCLALPLLVALLPLASATFVADERFHRWMLWLVVPTTVVALWTGWRRHHRGGVVVLGAIGVSLIAFAAYGPALVGLTETGDTVFTVIGALLLATAHVLNLRAQGRLHWHRPGERHDHPT